MTNLSRIFSFSDYRGAAKNYLPRMLFDYIDGGSYNEVTVRRNASDLDEVRLKQRIMLDMSTVDTSVEILGQRLPMPLGLGPVGFSGMYARRGEAQAARAAAAAGLPFCLSTVGICSVEEVAQASGSPPWFQLYIVKDREVVKDLLLKAKQVGCPALVLTVDLQTPGARYRDWRSGMGKPQGVGGQIRQALDGITHPRWLWDVYLRGKPHNFGNLTGNGGQAMGFGQAWDWIRANFDQSVTWADMEFIRAHWDGPIIVKGIHEVSDARAAIAAGADGIVVSNHGGRQLDTVGSSIRALPLIADAVGGAATIFFDGGIRSGLDILKAMSLGANACLIGKAWAFALAAGGEQGVTRMLNSMHEELRAAMVMTGCNSFANMSNDLTA